MSPTATIARNDVVLSSKVGDGVVMMDIERGLYYALEQTAARLWELTEHPTTLEALCARLVAEYDVDLQDCQREVQAFVEQLCERGVLTVVSDRP